MGFAEGATWADAVCGAGCAWVPVGADGFGAGAEPTLVPCGTCALAAPMGPDGTAPLALGVAPLDTVCFGLRPRGFFSATGPGPPPATGCTPALCVAMGSGGGGAGAACGSDDLGRGRFLPAELPMPDSCGTGTLGTLGTMEALLTVLNICILDRLVCGAFKAALGELVMACNPCCPACFIGIPSDAFAEALESKGNIAGKGKVGERGDAGIVAPISLRNVPSNSLICTNFILKKEHTS